MFLKNKKLRGMSLVELLAYTVILSIVTTALFQAIHFIEKMNDDLSNEQQMLNEFNLSILKLDEFVTNNNSDLIPTNNCLSNKDKAFHFEKDGNFYRLYESKSCDDSNYLARSSPIFNPIDTGNKIFFQNGNAKNSVKYSFIFKTNSEIRIDGSSYKNCTKP
jgi:type II secretory pathway pseudopilin PulG